MFWESPSGDVRTTIFLLIVALTISLVFLFFIKKKKILLSIFVFSVLANLVFYVQFITGSLMFRVYDLIWLQVFARIYWPIINVLLLFIIIFHLIKNAKK